MNNLIKICFSSIDGINKTHTFRTVKGARKFAFDRVGQQDVEGSYYAVSDDGVARITWSGITRAELFGTPAVELNKATTFYAKGDNLFCREAGYTHNHEGQLFGRVVPVMDNITGDHFAGWVVRSTDARQLFCSDQVFQSRERALEHAKACMLDYLDYLASDQS